MNAVLRNTYKVSDCMEISIDYNGCNYLVIFGRHINGGFCSIPNWQVCCEAGHPDDVFYNTEKLYDVLIDISYLEHEEQTQLYDLMQRLNICSITNSQSAEIKQKSQSGLLNEQVIELILTQEKSKKRKIHINNSRLSNYFNDDYSNEDIEQVIFELLEKYWKPQRED